MRPAKWIVIFGLTVLSSSAYASGKPVWTCDPDSLGSSLESVEIDQSASGLVGSVEYNHPFDDEGYYDVKVTLDTDRGGDLEFSGTGAHGGSFDLVLSSSGANKKGDRVRGVVRGVIPAEADTTYGYEDAYAKIFVTCQKVSE